MGIRHDAFDRWARESGRSPTILRRRLSKIDAIRRPEWARESVLAESLIPIVLAGAWDRESNADREILSNLASGDYQEVEKTVVRLLKIDDCPVWSVGQYRGVVSKIDALFAISGSLTVKNIEQFMELAKDVLSEPDPALDLPEDKRWIAGIYGKVRDHSTALRAGVCETLVLLAVHGKFLFQNRLGLDIEEHVSSLIRQLLTPLTLDKLLSHEHDLRSYAEAAPDEVLKLIERDLQQTGTCYPGSLETGRDRCVRRHPTRTGLLWALESLAWNPSEPRPRKRASSPNCRRTKIDDKWGQPCRSPALQRSTDPGARKRRLRLDVPLARALRCLLTNSLTSDGKSASIRSSLVHKQGMSSYKPRWRS